MSEYMFGVSTSKPSRKDAAKIEAVCEELGVTFVEYRDPGSGYRRWFAGPNRGEPFNARLENRTYEALEAAGVNLRAATEVR